MTDKELAKNLFLRNVNTTAFPDLVAVLDWKNGETHHVTQTEVDQARAALATTKMMYEYMKEVAASLEASYKMDAPLTKKK